MNNPFMSMFLSGANKIAGAARGQATAAVKREATKNSRQATKAWADALMPKAWADALMPKAAAPKRKKSVKK